MKQLHTVGHSIYEIEDFISLLKKNSINTIVDVRSTPYSKFASQYNREALKRYFKKNKIYYIFMGDLLGARYEDKSLLFDDGKVDFKKVQETKSFQDGITRLDKGITKGYNISLMCSEKEAFDCHRFGLVSEFLTKNSIEVNHIYPDKVVSQKILEQQLLKKYNKKLPKVDLFNSDITEDLQMKLAYKLRNKDIAYNSITKEGDD
ncbi:hypothetical protein THERMOT_2317 [Bathymodiolus thermophilus thioautotrophic gill symbiont]|uniref:DUF488 domain-containing protein n=1 Tax=Bathymodiolus thermophilus thioautotrophic gill symbiont TaxID=2360 RepID=A0A1J5TXQ8_9GAMM|nr:DUF488 domain-containing protein [Bathymodiolus thermophilus thioautotrophic gill symbiont]AYQ56966.1 hypothetical protein MS2017_1269 [Bathymodiolus thermophilus thioautotrophic gill symbiont]OIR25004.1 hypothetical protein BGC33_05170 [Bathymodiolus thermophilus thioautotrophic gill symbiont]CAB5505240.1 hypothetical protein THERMOS_2091 [Bathymodiolus thermophilus thioautotrophic gill symbiont]CAB5506355.1 hypothetical protein THERMOT_2317 [Bathymodiolus thermophilus thioautotrophic gill 